MNLETLLRQLIQATIHKFVSSKAQVVRIAQVSLDNFEGGNSGSVVKRYHVKLDSGNAITLITKSTQLKERLVMNLLSKQNHTNIPFSLSLDLNSDNYALVCMQDVSGAVTSFGDSAKIKREVASALAAIHFQNINRTETVSWLPPLDLDDFMRSWRVAWEGKLSIEEFAREFESYTPKLELSAKRFISTMQSYRREGDSLTVIHGDMLPPEFDHVIVHAGKPFIIDWGCTQYDSFYLDLPNYFSPKEALIYREELAYHGFEALEADFLDRYHEAGRYIGFKYLAAGLNQWGTGPTKRTGKLLLIAIRRAIDGSLPVLGFKAYGTAWRKLLDDHLRSSGHN